MAIRRPLQAGGLADRPVRRGMQDDHARATPAGDVGPQQVAFHRQPALGLVSDELADRAFRPILLQDRHPIVGPWTGDGSQVRLPGGTQLGTAESPGRPAS